MTSTNPAPLLPAALVRLSTALTPAAPGLAGEVEVHVLEVVGDPQQLAHLRRCVPSRGKGLGYARVGLAELPTRAWCEACTKARLDTLTLTVRGLPGDQRWALERVMHLIESVQRTEARFEKLGPASVSGRMELLTEHSWSLRDLSHLTRPGYAARLGVHIDEVRSWVEATIQSRQRARLEPNRRLRQRLAREAAARQGIVEVAGALEEDEVLIVCERTPQDGLGTQILAAYGLANPNGATVVRGPRFLLTLLVGEGALPQTTPAPDQETSVLAAALYEPGSKALGSIAHCVRAAKDVLAQ